MKRPSHRTAAQKKSAAAERELLRARAELEELQVRFDVVQLEAEELRELSARIESAKSAGDLFSA
jgi:hypothetical protein